MERNVSLEEITDGKKYHKNDMVRLGCNDCDGCSACCQGMGESIVLDPWDIHMLSQNLQQSFEDMIGQFDRIAFRTGDDPSSFEAEWKRRKMHVLK